MAEHTPESDNLDRVATAREQPKSRWSFQIVWLIPIVSALIGGWLAVKAIMERGPTITVTFQNAEGLEAGKTKVKYKDVEIGMVKAVTLDKDLKRVVATAELVKDFSPHLVEDTRFWVVRPRISGGTVSGLSTLLSGSYIGVDTGKSNKHRASFAGLETPPIVTIDTPGREFTLRSHNLASIDSGSPVFFRKLQAGQVTSYQLDKDGKGVTLKVFVNEPFVQFVTTNTRFFNASGVDLKLDASGIEVQMQSVVSLLLGGIAFETPDDNGRVVTAATTETPFRLYPNRAEALKNPDTDLAKFVLVFSESVRGLAPGAPVDFRGVVVGEVVAIRADIDPKTGQIIIPVDVNIYAERMRLRSRIAAKAPEARQAFIDRLVDKGLRAQLRTGSLLTGQLYVALDFFPQAKKAPMNWAATPTVLPTTPGARQELQQAIASVAAKIDRLPLDEIARDARTMMGSADKLIRRVDTEVTPDLRQTLQSGTRLLQRVDVEVVPEAGQMIVDARKALVSADRMLASESPIQQDARSTMREVQKAAHAFRMLADYLERNPSALLMGKKEDTP
ncbi:MAG TPA: MlaD family protein [Burkholderiales bacterium]|nr:MlaD family protein [Burkholderiales bacterium]